MTILSLSLRRTLYDDFPLPRLILPRVILGDQPFSDLQAVEPKRIRLCQISLANGLHPSGWGADFCPGG